MRHLFRTFGGLLRSRAIHGEKATKALLLVGFAMLGSMGPAQATSIIGDSVNAVYRNPTSTSIFYNGGKTTVSGSKIEYPNLFPGYISVDFTSKNIIVVLNFDGYFTVNSYEGLSFFDYNSPFTSMSLDTSSTSRINPADAFLSNGVISIDLSGLQVKSGQTIVLDVDTAHQTTVPEPASMAMLGVGLIGLGMVRGKRI